MMRIFIYLIVSSRYLVTRNIKFLEYFPYCLAVEVEEKGEVAEFLRTTTQYFPVRILFSFAGNRCYL